MVRSNWVSRMRSSMKRRSWVRRKSARARGAAVQLESLEPRVVLAADVMIAEVMSDNEDTLDDEQGSPSDWIELYNAGDVMADLTGWHLTDDSADRTQWTMEGGSIPPGESLLIFASNRDRRDPEGELHTNFRLSEGETLSLYEPDGRTLADSIDPLPKDYQDVSYGVSQNLADVTLLDGSSPVTVLMPSEASQDVPLEQWTGPDFDDASWRTASGGVGFDDDPNDGDFSSLIAEDGDLAADMQGATASAYLRSEFTLPESLPTYKNLSLDVNYDDGFIAYLNGREVARVNAPDDGPAWDSTATGQHGGIEANLAYPNFDDADDRDDYTLLGDAQWIDNRLALTSATENQTSAAWLTDPVGFGPDYTFSASTVYDIHTSGGVFADQDGLGGEGITFVLQGNDNNVLGSGGGGLGLDNTGSSFLSIELDSNATGSWDPDDALPSHLGVATSTDGSIARTAVQRFNGDAFFAGDPPPGNNLIYLWVDYVGETQTLDVYMATSDTKPDEPTLTVTVDLADLFADTPELYAGWTSSTSDAFNGHEVLGWSIITGVGELGREAETFNLSDHVDALRPGTNVLAVHALNIDAADEDLLSRTELTVQEVVLGERGYFLNPTPGELNGSSSLEPSGIVTFSRDHSVYVDSFDLELIPPTDDATIYYTLDGSIPDETSQVYTDPLRIDGPVRVRARAMEVGKGLSPVNTAGFSQLDESLTNFENGEVFTSNLPLVIFEGFDNNPDRQTTRLEPTVGYFFDVGDDGLARLTDEPEYAGRAGLRTRGQSSQGWSKKQYAVEIWEEGADDSSPIRAHEAPDLDVSIFGLPAESDWVLNGPYSDKTQLNNYLTFNWYNRIGTYAPRTKLVEVFVNPDGDTVDYESDYRGTYVLLEKIKVEDNRVDIAVIEPGDTEGDEITGGYIWKKDKAGAGDRPFNTDRGQTLRMVDPQDPRDRDNIQPGEITEVQKEWLNNYINEFEAALYGDNFTDPKEGYAAYIDIDSWVDTWLMVEMTKQIDGFRLSTYYHKDRGGKIHQGPAWDYNLALVNGNYLKGGYPEGWYHTGISSAQYPYWDRLFEDPNFEQAVADRWVELRQTHFTTENLMADIDEAVGLLSNNNPKLTNLDPGDPSNPISRNFDRWTTRGYGEARYHWPNCFFGQGDCPRSPLPDDMSRNGQPDSYDDYIYLMKWFLSERVEWMDSQFAPPLEISPESGPVDAGTQVTISAPAGYDPVYTLDGTDPRQPLIVKETTEILGGGGEAQMLVPTDDSLFDECDNGLRLPNDGSACFINPQYNVGMHGETWTDAMLPIGYDTEGDYTDLIETDVQEAVKDVNSSIYIRIPFEVDEAIADNAETMTLRARYDDGFVAYMWFDTLSTPIEIARANGGDSSRLPIDTVAFDATATDTNPDDQATQWQEFDVSNSISYLETDQTNYLVVQALNESVDSTDLLMDFSLEVGTERIEVSPSVIRYDGPVTIDRNTVLTARGFHPQRQEWTAASTMTYQVNAPVLTLTELNYNPQDPTEAELDVNPELNNDDFEFVELKNVGSVPTSLVGVQFDGFESILGDVQLQPGEYGVVVKDPEAFALRYGDNVNIVGEFFSGSLDNAGETISVMDTFGQTITSVSYNDSAIWPQAADGLGASLQLIDEDATPAEQISKYYSWRSSSRMGGTPGTSDVPRSGVYVNEVLTRTEPPVVDAIELVNSSDEAVDIGGWYLSDDIGNLQKYEIPAGRVLNAGQYMVFDESHFNEDPDNGFALSSTDGDDVWLTRIDANSGTVYLEDDVHFGPSLAEESFGRDGRGWLAPMQAVTLGEENAAPRVGPVVISEINYAPGEPTEADLAIHPELTSGDLEFIEVYNPTNESIELTDWEIRGGADYNFDLGDQLGAGETVVVIHFNPDNEENASRLEAFRNHYGLDESVRIVGAYDGRLAGDGERIALTRPDTSLSDQPIVLPQVQEDEVIYDDRFPWPVEADGQGMSLTRNSVMAYGNDGQSWTAAPPSPGSVNFEPQPGDFDGDGRLTAHDIDALAEQLRSGNPDSSFDLNGDGSVDDADRDFLVVDLIGTSYGDADLNFVFDSRDLVRLFQVGEYEDGIDGNSTWEDGDWNGDGDFTSEDLLLAAQGGGYVEAPPTPAPARAASALDRPASAGTDRSDAVAALQADRALEDFSSDELDDDLLEVLI